MTSIREEPLRASLSSGDNVTTENSNDDDDDDLQSEIEVDEKRPLLSPRRNSSRSYNLSNKRTRSTANMYFSDWNRHEGFVEIDLATGGRIPHDHVVERPCKDILLRTFHGSHETAAEQISDSDSFNLSRTQTLEFDTELQRKAKLIKLGIQVFRNFRTSFSLLHHFKRFYAAFSTSRQG